MANMNRFASCSSCFCVYSPFLPEKTISRKVIYIDFVTAATALTVAEIA